MKSLSRLPFLASLRARMTAGFTLAFAAFVAIACGVFIWTRWHSTNQKAISAAHEGVLIAFEEINEGNGFATAFREVREQRRMYDVAIRVVDAHGQTLGSSQRRAPSWPHNDSDGWLIETRPQGANTIVAGVYWRAIDAELDREAVLLSALCVPITAAAALLAWVLVGRTLRPIGALADQAGSVTDDLLNVHLAEPSPDTEVRRLVTTLNGLLSRLRRSAETREQFYAAAAHELRTPLSVLAGTIEVALGRPRTTDEYVETLTDLQGETKRLVALAEGLLTLNRLQMHAGGSEAPVGIDLVEPCANALSAFAAIVQARELRVETEWPESDTATCAPKSHVEMLTRNLIENAVKYATPGGVVRLGIQPTDAGIRLRVFNEYLKAGQLPVDRLFEAFYRADASRSSETGGNGLGLAICRQIADANHWTLTMAATPDGINSDVIFPRG